MHDDQDAILPPWLAPSPTDEVGHAGAPVTGGHSVQNHAHAGAVGDAPSEICPAVPGSASSVGGADAGLASRANQLEGLRAIEDRLLAKSLIVTEASLDFASIDLDDLEGSKARFVDEHGPVEGPRRFRVALANWQDAKRAPVGLKNAVGVTVALLKSKSNREAAPSHLNLTFVQMTAPATEVLDAITVDE